MAADDLSAPLGRNPTQQAPKIPRLPIAPARLLAAALGLLLAVFVGWMLVVKDPQGGEPIAIVELPAVGAQPRPRPAGQPKPEVTRSASKQASRRMHTASSRSSTARPANGRKFRFAPAESKPGGGDTRLLEQTRHGMIPKIAADGTRPSEAYAAPRPPADADRHAAHRDCRDRSWHRRKDH